MSTDFAAIMASINGALLILGFVELITGASATRKKSNAVTDKYQQHLVRAYQVQQQVVILSALEAKELKKQLSRYYALRVWASHGGKVFTRIWVLLSSVLVVGLVGIAHWASLEKPGKSSTLASFLVSSLTISFLYLALATIVRMRCDKNYDFLEACYVWADRLDIPAHEARKTVRKLHRNNRPVPKRVFIRHAYTALFLRSGYELGKRRIE
ncbi:hypothetical protein [Streptomyces sp. NBC_00887]|uniref:hypothetical protein n=1 Tax=Streptomyces sp. NBC_00887 TaxID=2975859 RepID=UPI00386A2550|nr:hypothetical protein OG844_46785 [Streptomyces sp. NBC_00887]